MSRPSRFLLAAVAMLALFAAGAASAQQRYYDPPGRVARISDMRGYVSYSPGGDGEWYEAHRNRPLVRGDALWSDRGARVELQAGSTWLRMDQETSVELLQLDDRRLQVQVAEGSVNLRVRRLYPGQRIEIDTPNLAFVIDRPGNFRLDVDRDADNTTIEARQGGGRVYGIGGRFDVRVGDVVVFYGEDVRDYELYAFPAQDGFDRYVRQRDQRIDSSPSLRYLGDDLVGFSDLDNYGRWSRYPSYGAVWFPTKTYAGWAPYQDGQWVWQEPWGWTWVDEQPWGFAPSHYGRWAWIDGRWGWVPGPRSQRPVYAPALVAFLELAGGSIGWFPLGPSDVYYPTYNVSSNYFRSVNIANTNVNTASVNKGYTSYARAAAVPLAQGSYRNRTVASAVTAVPQDVFANSRPVRQARRDERQAAAAAGGRVERGEQMRRSLAVRPSRASMQGAAAKARVRPPRAVEEEQVIVHEAPPAAATPSATGTPAPAAPARERTRRVRQVSEQQAATDARARGPRQQGESAAAATAPATPAATTPATATAPGGGRLKALDREALQQQRAARRQERQQRQQGESAAPAASAPAAAARTAPAAPAAPAAAAAPATPAASAPAPARAEPAREAEEARAAQRKAREEQREALEAQRKAQQEQRESERALQAAKQQREQAQAESTASGQREAAAAETKAVEERQQAREAQRDAQREQREAQQAQRKAAQEQAQAAQTPASPAPEAPATAKPDAPARGIERRDCVPQERIDAMRKRGVPEERVAELKACPVEPQPQTPQQQ